jgi:hypothetical protein
MSLRDGSRGGHTKPSRVFYLAISTLSRPTAWTWWCQIQRRLQRLEIVGIVDVPAACSNLQVGSRTFTAVASKRDSSASPAMVTVTNHWSTDGTPRNGNQITWTNQKDSPQQQPHCAQDSCACPHANARYCPMPPG